MALLMLDWDCPDPPGICQLAGRAPPPPPLPQANSGLFLLALGGKTGGPRVQRAFSSGFLSGGEKI
jgi:hypothetical protein